MEIWAERGILPYRHQGKLSGAQKWPFFATDELLPRIRFDENPQNIFRYVSWVRALGCECDMGGEPAVIVVKQVAKCRALRTFHEGGHPLALGGRPAQPVLTIDRVDDTLYM